MIKVMKYLKCGTKLALLLCGKEYRGGIQEHLWYISNMHDMFD